MRSRFLTIIALCLLTVFITGLSPVGTSSIGPTPPSDVAYNAVTWNGSFLAPTQNAVRDIIVTGLQPLSAALISISALEETAGGFSYATADNVYAWLNPGVANSLLVGSSSTTVPTWVLASGTGAPVLNVSPTLTTPTTVGIATIGDGGTTNYASFSAAGLMTFIGNSGFLFGCAYGDHIGWSVAASQNIWYNISDSSMVDNLLRGVTHDGDGLLTVTEPGIWLVIYNTTIACTAANEHLDTGIEINSSGSAEAVGRTHIEIKFANQEEVLTGFAILDLADNSTIEIAIMTIDADPGPTISVENLQLLAILIGGT